MSYEDRWGESYDRALRKVWSIEARIATLEEELEGAEAELAEVEAVRPELQAADG